MRSRLFPSSSATRSLSSPTRATLAALAVVGLAACGDDNSGATAPAPAPAPTLVAQDFQRLLVADGTAPVARLINLSNDSTVDSYTLAGPASLVYRTTSGRFAIIQQRAQSRVAFVDAGVWADASIGHRRAPARVGFELTDGLPTHESVNGPWISIFFDGNGRAVWMNEADKLAGAPRIAFEIQTGAPHHSGSATMMVNNTPFFVVAPFNPTGALPNAVEVRNQSGAVVARVDNCPSMHGNNAISTGVVFGCQDGMVLVRANGATVSATKVTPTGDMAGLGLRNAYSQSGAPFIVGQFSAPPGQPTQRVLATIDPVTGAIGRLPALPVDVRDHWRAIEPVKGQIAMLGTNGTLYVYNGITRTLQHTVANVVPAIAATGALTHQVSMMEDVAAVASPTTGEVVMVNTVNGTITRRIRVGGAPSRLTLTGATRSGTYTAAR